MNGVKEEEDLCFCMLLLDWLYRDRIRVNDERLSPVSDIQKSASLLAGEMKCCTVRIFNQFKQHAASERKENLNQINVDSISCSMHICTKVRDFCRIIVRYMINQLYQTGVSDHTFYMWA